MKRYQLVTIATLLVFGKSVHADTTWGIGVGPLYNGIGLNFGKTTPSSFAYGALGCHGVARGKSTSFSKSDTESNCGFGFGYVSTSLIESNRHGFGLGLDTTYNTAKSQTEMRLRPGYYYFLNGINGSGLNLGVGPSFYYDTERSNDQDHDPVVVFFNVGYQF